MIRYDEYDNYYDADGNPATDPEYSEEDDEEGIIGLKRGLFLNYIDEDVDVEKLAKDYADDEEEGDELEHYENLYLNTGILLSQIYDTTQIETLSYKIIKLS